MRFAMPTFFMHEPWLSVPFEKVPKDVHTQLFDVMVQLPTLLALSSQLGSRNKSNTCFVTAEAELINLYAKVKDELTSWHGRLDSAWKQTFTRTKSTSWPGSTITFATAGHANVWVHYWMARMALHLVIARAAPHSCYFAAHVDVQAGAKYAEDICASEEYCTAPQRGAVFLVYYIAPLKTVIQFYDAHAMDMEKQMALDVATRMASSGFAVTRTMTVQVQRDHSAVTTFQRVIVSSTPVPLRS